MILTVVLLVSLLAPVYFEGVCTGEGAMIFHLTFATQVPGSRRPPSALGSDSQSAPRSRSSSCDRIGLNSPGGFTLPFRSCTLQDHPARMLTEVTPRSYIGSHQEPSGPLAASQLVIESFVSQQMGSSGQAADEGTVTTLAPIGP